MRARLVAAFVGLTIAIVALYGIPRAYLLADLIRSQEQDQVDRMAKVVVVALEQRMETRDAVDPGYLSRLAGDGNSIVVRMPGKPSVSSEHATSNDGDLTARAALPDGGSVTVVRSGDMVGKDISEALLPLLLIGLGLVVVVGIGAVALSRRMARPFQDLAAAARGLGSGALHPELPTYRVPEAQAISEALRTSGARIEELLEHERDLATAASHELRTPVTALRLELEDLAAWPETPASVAAELTRATEELDRLSIAISGVLERVRAQRSDAEIDLDLDVLVGGVITRLQERYPSLTFSGGSGLLTRLDPDVLERVVDLLVLEACRGGAQVTVATSDAGSHLEVRVARSEPVDAEAQRPPGPRAADLAGALGGQLGRDPDGTAVLRVPRRVVRGVRTPGSGQTDPASSG